MHELVGSLRDARHRMDRPSGAPGPLRHSWDKSGTALPRAVSPRNWGTYECRGLLPQPHSRSMFGSRARSSPTDRFARQRQVSRLRTAEDRRWAPGEGSCFSVALDLTEPRGPQTILIVAFPIQEGQLRGYCIALPSLVKLTGDRPPADSGSARCYAGYRFHSILIRTASTQRTIQRLTQFRPQSAKNSAAGAGHRSRALAVARITAMVLPPDGSCVCSDTTGGSSALPGEHTASGRHAWPQCLRGTAQSGWRRTPSSRHPQGG